MKLQHLFLSLAFLLVLLPLTAFGAASPEVGGPLSTFLGNVIGFINRILIPLALAIAFIFLVWGIVKYFVIGGDSDDGKSKGKDLIIYSLVGFVVIFSFYGLVNLLTGGLGLGGNQINSDDIPSVPIPVTPGANN